MAWSLTIWRASAGVLPPKGDAADLHAAVYLARVQPEVRSHQYGDYGADDWGPAIPRRRLLCLPSRKDSSWTSNGRETRSHVRFSRACPAFFGS